ncbi:polysaccharide biosynthesis protein [Streptomyces fuscichromogenes]|uniref:polysaccharide biosynthesis protein n=1 Tax=Streptomyces fuscichromogenes TaxID=1324013 RepID=UPI0038099A04
MNEDTIRLATIGRILRWRWRLLVALAAVGAFAGYGASVLAFPPRYTASAPVLLPGQWEDRQLLTQVDIATSSAVLDRTAAALHWSGVSGTTLQDRVTAKAADGNIIKISGTADTPTRAQRLSDQVAQQFVAFATKVAGNSSDPVASATAALRKQVADTNRRISQLAKASDPGQTVESVQTRTELEQLRSSLEDAMQKLDQADPATDKAGPMVVMGPAPRPTGEAPPTRPQLVVAGALLSFLVTLVGHLVAARMNRRLRTEPEIAAALGSTLLGTVDVPAERTAHRRNGWGPRALIRRLLGMNARWDMPAPQKSGDQAGSRIRYRRVCTRLKERLPGAQKLLVVVPDGDETARRAAGQLAAEAKNGLQLRAVEVSVDRPTVPDREGESGALVVLSAGSWTAEELAGIAEACADARHEVVGIVVAGLVLARPTRHSGQLPDDATLALALPGHGTGGPA